jgi:hypothetical protein
VLARRGARRLADAGSTDAEGANGTMVRYCAAVGPWAVASTPHNAGSMLRAMAAAGLGFAVLAAGRRFRDWGATKGECAIKLPGDELIPDPADVTTRAVTIEAPAAEVWRWLVQIGQDRGGLYSYDWLENAAGLRIHSAKQIRPEWQRLQVGDTVRLVRRGWLGLHDGVALPVARVDPGRSIALRQQPPNTPWNGIWSFHVVPHGSGRCRLISRARTARSGRCPWIVGQLMDPLALVMTRRMLHGIKARAERPAAHP